MVKEKILITGAFGFIGSHLTEFLVKKNYNVIAFDKYNIDNSYGWLENSKLKKNIEFILGDVRDFDSVFKAMKGAKKCIHLAALISIPYSYTSPLAYLKTNTEGSYNVLEAAKMLQIDDTIVTSTSEIYGSAQYSPMDELHPISPQSPYAASKVAADQLALSYFKSFDLPVKIARPFNVFGPRQSPRAIVASIINQLLVGDKLRIGNLDVSRDLTYIDDTIDGFYKILKSKKIFGEVINIGSNNNIKIKEIVKIVSDTLNCKPKLVIENKRLRPNKSEVSKLICNNTKIKKRLKWDNKISFKKGIQNTIEWNKKNYSEFKKSHYYV